MPSFPSDPVLNAVHARLRQWNVRGPLLVAVSGGADSLALLRCCQLLQDHLGLIVHAAHFDHRLRAESHLDSDWVQARCRQWNIPVHCGCRDAASRDTHIEEDARHDRYDFLKQTAREQHCAWLATGHTANDQAETVLHHVLRGTGLAGLSGMPESRPLSPEVQLVRPLLDVPRETLQQWLQTQHIDWRDDPSNQNESLTRNWLRHRLLPMVRDRINPRVDTALHQLASHARDSQIAINWAADQLQSHVTLEDSEHASTMTIDCAPLRNVPSSILTAFFTQLWINAEWPRQRMSTKHWQALTQLVQHTGHPTGHSLPGSIQAEWYRGQLTLRRLTE